MHPSAHAATDVVSPPCHRSDFHLSPALLCTVGRGGAIEEANVSFLEALDYEDTALLGQHFIDLVHPDDRDATLAELASLADEPHRAAFENRFRLPDASYRWLAWRVRADVELGLHHCAARDETDRHEQADVVARLLAELERSNTDLAQFAYVASHDLSEPLRMVSSYVQLLADRYRGQLDDDADEFIAFAVDGATRMKVLIDDLLAYSRAGGAALVRRPVDCGVLVRTSVADLDRVVTESGAHVTIDELPTVLGDPAQLAQVFQNLLSNALKFIEAGGAPVVRVSAERMGRGWCFSVSDNGIGIAPVHRERIFLMFKRLHGRTEYPGTGIGLALCHKIVTRFGGRIWLEGDAAEGTVVRFTVPDLLPMAEGA